MKIVINTTELTDANKFGEILRENLFTQNGFGCYQNFDLIDDFGSYYKGNSLYDSIHKKYFAYLDDDNPVVYVSIKNKKVFVAWHWDGDGTLIVSDGQRAAINTDCKKSDRWQWADMP